MARGRETADYMRDMARMIAAAGRRASRADPDMLAALLALHEAVDAAALVAVAGQRATGITWESIGEALGVTRQAVIMRWSHALGELETVT